MRLPQKPCFLTVFRLFQFKGNLKYDVKNMDKQGYNYLVE